MTKHEIQILREVLALKARIAAAEVVRWEIVERLDRAGEEAAPQRAVRDEAHAERAYGLEHAILLDVSRPERILRR